MFSVEILNTLLKFQDSAHSDTFNEIFGETGPHLWKKFQDWDFQVLELWRWLDGQNGERLIAHLNANFGASDCYICWNDPALREALRDHVGVCSAEEEI